MAAATGMSQSTVSRIWRAFALAPHRLQTFKLSTDPLFIDKVRDVVGLYLDPPEKALVLCVDEKSQIQALDRSQPVLPMMPGMPERRTHDYLRHGLTSLFAAFNIADGTVIGETARALARMYAALIGKVDGRAPALLARPGVGEQAGGKDQVILIPSRFSAGYMLPTESNPMLGVKLIRPHRSRRGARLRRSGARCRLRVCDEQHRRGHRRCACVLPGRDGV